MFKSYEALFRGYFLFRVNKSYFFIYASALEERKRLYQDPNVSIFFEGLHIWKGWTGFFYRLLTQ